MKNIFTKKYFLMLAVMILLSFGCFNLVSGAEAMPFPDVPQNHWAVKNVENLYAKGLVNGFEDGTFRGDNKLRASEFVKMLVCYYDYQTGDTTPDKPEGTPWFEKYYEKAIGIGIIDRSKYADGYNYEVTRKEAALLMYNTLINNVETMNFTKPDSKETIPFSDIKGLDTNYYRAIQDLCFAGIIDGYENGTYQPEGILTRYEATKLIEVFMSKQVKLIKPKSNVTNDVYQVNYKYEDDGIPGHGYEIKFNVPRKTISIFSMAHSSTLDLPERRNAYNIDWSNDEVWYKQVQDVFANRYEKDKDSFGILCDYITDVGAHDESEWSKSTDPDWKDYSMYDTNKDNVVTKFEYANAKLASYIK